VCDVCAGDLVRRDVRAMGLEQIQGPPLSSLAIIYRWRRSRRALPLVGLYRVARSAFVRRFVDRYIPGYIFFGDGVRDGVEGGERIVPPWLGQGLVLELDEERQLVNTHQF